MPYTANQPEFGAVLRAAGWHEIVPFVEFRRENRMIVFDTSSCMELYSGQDCRIADIAVPTPGQEQEAMARIEEAFAAAKRS